MKPWLGLCATKPIWRERLDLHLYGFGIFETGFGGAEIRRLHQHLVAALFQRDVVVVRQRVKPMHAEAFIEEKPRQVEADETSGACEKDFLQCGSLCE